MSFRNQVSHHFQKSNRYISNKTVVHYVNSVTRLVSVKPTGNHRVLSLGEKFPVCQSMNSKPKDAPVPTGALTEFKIRRVQNSNSFDVIIQKEALGDFFESFFFI